MNTGIVHRTLMRRANIPPLATSVTRPLLVGHCIWVLSVGCCPAVDLGLAHLPSLRSPFVLMGSAQSRGGTPIIVFGGNPEAAYQIFKALAVDADHKLKIAMLGPFNQERLSAFSFSDRRTYVDDTPFHVFENECVLGKYVADDLPKVLSPRRAGVAAEGGGGRASLE